MIQPVVVAAAASVIGGVIAVTARDGRLVAVGLMLAMVAAALAGSSEPAGLAVAFRVLGGLLAAYLLWAAAQTGSVSSEGSGIGLLAELAIALAAFWIGWVVEPVKPLAGPLAAQAGGFSLVALAIVPLTGRDVLRVGAGATLLVTGGFLLAAAWAGPAPALGQIAITALLVGTVGATSLLASPLDTPAALRKAAAAAPDRGQVALEEPASEEPARADGELGSEDGPQAGPAGRQTRRTGRQASRAAAAPSGAEAAAPSGAEAAGPASAGPVSPNVRRTRPTSVRTLPARSLRRGDARTEPEAAPRPSPVEGAMPGPSEPSPQTRPAPNRVRRLRPREPRR